MSFGSLFSFSFDPDPRNHRECDMAERGQIRIIRDPKRATSLHQASNVKLITPIKASQTPQNTYYETQLQSVPLSILLDPIFRIPNIVGHTQTSLTETSATLLPKSLHISVPNHLFHTLGLQASRKHAPPQSIPPSRRTFVPVSLNLPLTARNLTRARWALSPHRFPRFDITLSAGPHRIKAPAGIHNTESVVTRHRRIARMNIPRLNHDDEIWDTLENVQAVGTFLEDGEDVNVAEYRALVNSQVLEDVVCDARKIANDCGWAVVMACAPCAPLVWRNGISRGGFAQGFGGDAAEVFVATADKTVSVQLRAGLDVI